MVELIPYNWHGTGFGEVYRNITWSTADVHHVAWRARHSRWALYNSTDDQRYSSWTAKECESQCVFSPCPPHRLLPFERINCSAPPSPHLLAPHSAQLAESILVGLHHQQGWRISVSCLSRQHSQFPIHKPQEALSSVLKPSTS